MNFCTLLALVRRGYWQFLRLALVLLLPISHPIMDHRIRLYIFQTWRRRCILAGHDVLHGLLALDWEICLVRSFPGFARHHGSTGDGQLCNRSTQSAGKDLHWKTFGIMFPCVYGQCVYLKGYKKQFLTKRIGHQFSLEKQFQNKVLDIWDRSIQANKQDKCSLFRKVQDKFLS